MNFLFGLLGFALTIGILVTIHEWGHFYVARLCNVKILRFSIGFGPALLRWRGKKDGTLYTLAPILLGGYVQMLGETPGETVPAEDRARTFKAQSPAKRFLIVLAGPAINLIFAVLMFAALYLVGVKGLRAEVAHVTPTSLAATAGLEPGDRITAINGQPIRLSVDVHVALSGVPRGPVALELERDGQPLQRELNLGGLKKGDELRLAEALGLQAGDIIRRIDGQDTDLIHFAGFPAASSRVALTVERAGQIVELAGALGRRDGKPFLGVRWQALTHAHFQPYETVESYPLLSALQRGLAKVGYYTEFTYRTFGRLLSNRASRYNMGGPLTIGDMAGRSLRYGWDVFLNFLGVVSLSLAAINLLPVPLLDGGHMLFCVLEMVRGKPLPDPAMKWLNYLGAGLIYALMLLVVGKDLWTYLW